MHRASVEQFVQNTASIAETVFTYLDEADLTALAHATERDDGHADVLGAIRFADDGIVDEVDFRLVGLRPVMPCMA